MGLAGAAREAVAAVPAVASAAAVAVNGGGGGSGGEWAPAIAIDGSLGVTLALIVLALECALFAAVIVQTASTEPGTHMPLSRSFTLLFGLTSATAGLTAITTLFGSASPIAHAAATVACVCLAGSTLGTLPAAAAVVFPEAHRGPEKAAARCRLTAGVYPDTCPFPRVFDHNAVAVTGLLVVAALAAEAALRLMAAGNGARGYVEIP
ncbi:hypothetical protein MMPV_000583 [Pyropia vietnamensis]